MKMTKNVLVLHCSPREGGNTHSLAEMFSAGAEASSHRVTRLNIGKAIIGPCVACDYCILCIDYSVYVLLCDDYLQS